MHDHQVFIDAVIVIAVFGLLFMILLAVKKRIRGSGGGLFLTVSGASDAFYDQEKKKAVETIAERNAHKKMEEQSSADPRDKKGTP